MIRVLHELGNLDGGGVARLIYDYYRHMNHEKVHFDFIINDEYTDGILEQPLREMGCTIYKIPALNRNAIARLRKLERIVREGHYDVVHSHIASRCLFLLYFGKKFGVKFRFAHSHIAYQNISFMHRTFDKIMIAVAKTQATQLLACGHDAGVYMWGKREVNSGKVKIVRNAVDTGRFRFSEEERIRLRKQYGFDNRIVLGIVGRLIEQKNDEFMLEVFREVLKKRKDAVLAFVGRGPLEEKLKDTVNKWGINESVLFLGVRNDVEKLLNMFDVFVLPSLYEGLPVVLVEAQANGLSAVVSDRITKEVQVTDLIQYVSLEKSPQEWANIILNTKLIPEGERLTYAEKVCTSGYDISNEAAKLEEFYKGGNT